MKKLVCCVSALAATFFAQAMSLSDARAQIGACIGDAAKMATVAKDLAAADQVAFLAEVNEAIAGMPGSNEAKAAAYLNANKAVLKSAAKGNLAALLAEVFATVSPEAMPMLCERLSADLFNRSADPTKSFTDEQFLTISESVMAKVNERMSSVENGAARSAFAVVMLVQASNGSPANLADVLVKTLPESAREAAGKEWIPAALGKGQPQSYEPILAAADAAAPMPASVVVLRIAGPQLLDTLLSRVVENTKLRGDWDPEFPNSGVIPLESEIEFPYERAYEHKDKIPSDEPHGYPNEY